MHSQLPSKAQKNCIDGLRVIREIRTNPASSVAWPFKSRGKGPDVRRVVSPQNSALPRRLCQISRHRSACRLPADRRQGDLRISVPKTTAKVAIRGPMRAARPMSAQTCYAMTMCVRIAPHILVRARATVCATRISGGSRCRCRSRWKIPISRARPCELRCEDNQQYWFETTRMKSFSRL